MTHATEIESGVRFKFGENWSRFLPNVKEAGIREAAASLCRMLEVPDLRGKTFLDIGSGSGLFSLAAHSLGARVVSFDYDPLSVACTDELRRRYGQDGPVWRVLCGSVLDPAFLEGLGSFDVVYSWGVLHHTSAMWQALENAAGRTASGGQLYVALYNYQPVASRYWAFVKRTYNKSTAARIFWSAIHSIYPLAAAAVLRASQGRKIGRGMSAWRDLQDWLGGYPFEVAKPEQVFEFCKDRGFVLTKLTTVGGRLGCNEFVFVAQAQSSSSC